MQSSKIEVLPHLESVHVQEVAEGVLANYARIKTRLRLMQRCERGWRESAFKIDTAERSVVMV